MQTMVDLPGMLHPTARNVELAEDFLASTFGSSTEFYDAILPEAGAISCYLPAGESKVYN